MLQSHHTPPLEPNALAESVLAAAHRRDHAHTGTHNPCRPHVVEVVHLGSQAVMVCHDCLEDSGFVAHRHAEHLAAEHQLLTTMATVTPLARSELR
jgi:hypothetical protein